MTTPQPQQKQQQVIQELTIKGAEIQQLQQIIDRIPTQYGRVFDAFFSGVQKRRNEEAVILAASKKESETGTNTEETVK
jgi:hypothetical protein